MKNKYKVRVHFIREKGGTIFGALFVILVFVVFFSLHQNYTRITISQPNYSPVFRTTMITIARIFYQVKK